MQQICLMCVAVRARIDMIHCYATVLSYSILQSQKPGKTMGRRLLAVGRSSFNDPWGATTGAKCTCLSLDEDTIMCIGQSLHSELFICVAPSQRGDRQSQSTATSHQFIKLWTPLSLLKSKCSSGLYLGSIHQSHLIKLRTISLSFVKC